MKLSFSKKLMFLYGFFTLVLCSQSVWAATYYVSTSGSDSSPGSQSAPFRHVSKGAAVARAGDTVIVMDGTYDNEGAVGPSNVVTLQYSGTASAPITFKAQNRGRAILDAMNTSTGISCNGAAAYFNLYFASYIVIEGFVIQRGCNEAIHSNDGAHDIVIRWNEMKDIANHATDSSDEIGKDGIYLNEKEYNFTFDGNIFHNIGRTSGPNLLHFDHGIYSHAKNVLIVNNIFYDMTKGFSIQLATGAENHLIANNVFAFPNSTQADEDGQIVFWGTNTNIVVRNNIFYQPTRYALYQVAASLSVTVDHNIVYGVSNMVRNSTGFSIGTNQMGVDPQFVNASSAPYDFHLRSSSPGLGTGVNLSNSFVNDLQGIARSTSGVWSLGVYAGSGSSVTSTLQLDRAGYGCEDAMCVWVAGSGFTSSSYVATRDTSWNLIATYPVSQVVHTLNSNPQVLAIRLASDYERQLFSAKGLIITVVNSLADKSWNSIAVAPPPPQLFRSGYGCDDGMCVWVTGSAFTNNSYIVVRDSTWNPIATYTGSQVVRTLGSNPQVLAVRLASDYERQLARSSGLIVTVVNSLSDKTWNSIGVSR